MQDAYSFELCTILSPGAESNLRNQTPPTVSEYVVRNCIPDGKVIQAQAEAALRTRDSAWTSQTFVLFVSWVSSIIAFVSLGVLDINKSEPQLYYSPSELI